MAKQTQRHIVSYLTEAGNIAKTMLFIPALAHPTSYAARAMGKSVDEIEVSISWENYTNDALAIIAKI